MISLGTSLRDRTLNDPKYFSFSLSLCLLPKVLEIEPRASPRLGKQSTPSHIPKDHKDHHTPKQKMDPSLASSEGWSSLIVSSLGH
jgi:hypothetical protein